MPTAARLVAAVCLAFLGWVASEMVKPLMPEDTAFGWFSWINAGLGAVCGWKVIGSRAGRGNSAAIGNGLTGMAALVFWALFVQAVYEMIRLALRRRFDDPLEAIGAVFELIVKFGAVLADPGLLATLLIGGVLAGLAAEAASRRWR